MKVFNTTGLCNPDKHYMVDITERLSQIKTLIDSGKYFAMNRARQYGKTTTLNALNEYLKGEYIVVQLDFQDLDQDVFGTGGSFTQALARLFMDSYEFSDVPIPQEYLDAFEKLNDKDTVKMDEIFRVFRRWCMKSDRPVVLMIDEVDSAADHQSFLDFLAQLRSLYLKREQDSKNKTFQSVILAGVTDVKHLKSRIREEDTHKVNSPWNIADDFDMDMSLSVDGIKEMLDEYEKDHHTGMNTEMTAMYIHDYTSGYPFLVSRICQILDEKLVPAVFARGTEAWTKRGLNEAVKLLLSESNTLFESLTGKLSNYPELRESLRSILLEGNVLPYNALQESILQMKMYGFIRNDHNRVVISNRIFETILYNLLLSDEELKNNVFMKEGSLEKNLFVKDGELNMRLILERFILTFTQIYGRLEEKFQEKDGRELFLLYLKLIINGTGNYYIEAQTRDQTRTDVIVDYLGKQYVVELKIWRGPGYNEAGERQLKEYLDYFHLDTGYMLSFNFNKKKEIGVKRINVGDKVVFEGTV